MQIVRAAAAVLVVLTVALGSTERAVAASTDIGAVTEIRDATPPSPTAAGGNVVQVAEASGTYAVPAGYGMITSWRHSAGASAGTLKFKVYRPTGALREFLVVASDTRAVAAGTVQSFPVQIPVLPGDRIGLSSEDLQLVYETFDPADKLGFFEPDPPRGTTKATDGQPFPEFKLDVAATLESTADAPSPGSTPPPSADPPSAGPAPGSTTSPPPAVTKLRVAPRAFAAARGGASVTTRPNIGARVSFSLRAKAAVRFTIRRSRPSRRNGTRTVTLAGGFMRRATRGPNAFRFTGRLGGQPLKPGAYTLVATPRVEGRRGTSATSRFRIIR